MDHTNHLTTAIQAAVEAGKAVLDVYNTDFQVDYKDDQSPLTLADKKAHDIIVHRSSALGLTPSLLLLLFYKLYMVV